MASYKVLVTSGAAGSFVKHAELEKANVENIVRQLNDPGSAEVTMQTTDAKLRTEVGPYTWQRDLQIWRNNTLRHWGPITRLRADGNKTAIQSKGFSAHFMRRYFGPTPSLAGFLIPTTWGTTTSTATAFPHAGLTGWTATGCTQSISTDTRVRGANSLKLVRTGAAGSDAYTEFWFDYEVEPGPVGGGGFIPIFVPGWFFSTSLDPALLERGLYVRSEAPSPGTIYDEQWAPITEATPVNGWYRLEVACKLRADPAATTNRIFIRLYAPGTIYWDAVNVFRTRTVGAAIAPAGPEILDYGVILGGGSGRVLEYATGASADAVAMGKSDLDLLIDIPNCGVTDYRNYDLSSNQNVWEALSEYVTRGLYDFDITWNAAGTERTIKGYTPRKGSYRPELRLELGRNIVGFTYEIDGDQVTTKPRVLGRGEGASREIGEAMDTTLLGGLTLESVETAAADAPLSSLDSRAAELLRIGKAPTKVPTLSTKEGAAGSLLDGGLDVGDTVPVKISHGWANENSTRRIVYIKEIPGNETLDIGFNDQ